MKDTNHAHIFSAVLLFETVPVGEYRDSIMSEDIKNAIDGNGLVRVTGDGHTVTLTGIVEDAYAVVKAEKQARELGAKKVINKLLFVH